MLSYIKRCFVGWLTVSSAFSAAFVPTALPHFPAQLISSHRSLQQQARPFCKAAPPAFPQPARGRPADAVRLRDDRFVKVAANGSSVRIHAFNWFGFNNGQTALDGLWAGGNAAQSDMATIVHQMKLLGFNAVRIPFLFKDLRLPAKPIKSYCTPVTDAYLRRRTIDPLTPNAANGKQLPKPVPALPAVGGERGCNHYTPEDSTINRYLWTIQWFVANGYYVLIDYHPMGHEWVQNDLPEFVASWKWLWGRVACLPNFESDLKGRVFVDIMNEPDSVGVRWEPTPNSQGQSAGLAKLYHSTMSALWAMTPGAVTFFIEGGGQGGLLGTNWGNGFATDANLIRENGLSDPNPFFKTLMSRPYRRNVVVSPHVYGPSVTNTQNFKGPAFFDMLDNTFGYLTKRGYCVGADCQRFPVVIGEFGSRFKDPRDIEHLNDFASYLNNAGPGATGAHNAIGNWMYWSFNANSADTGGLVDDSFRDLMWVKLRYLAKLGLRPWYRA